MQILQNVLNFIYFPEKKNTYSFYLFLPRKTLILFFFY